MPSLAWVEFQTWEWSWANLARVLRKARASFAMPPWVSRMKGTKIEPSAAASASKRQRLDLQQGLWHVVGLDRRVESSRQQLGA